MITIGSLADHPETIPILVKWFRDQWAEYYADRSDEMMEQGFRSEANTDRVPSRLVAFEMGELAGTIVLREDGTGMPPEFQPELGGLFVVEAHRGHGIATALVRAGMDLARGMGYETVFATTVAADGILERLGWVLIQTVTYQDGPSAVYRCRLVGPVLPDRSGSAVSH